MHAGTQGMIHVSEMSWSRVEHPDDVVKAGQALRCKVVHLDREKDKVYLSLKARRCFLPRSHPLLLWRWLRPPRASTAPACLQSPQGPRLATCLPTRPLSCPSSIVGGRVAAAHVGNASFFDQGLLVLGSQLCRHIPQLL